MNQRYLTFAFGVLDWMAGGDDWGENRPPRKREPGLAISLRLFLFSLGFEGVFLHGMCGLFPSINTKSTENRTSQNDEYIYIIKRTEIVERLRKSTFLVSSE